MDPNDIKQIYSYTANSNLVLQPNRPESGRIHGEPTGAPTSLAGMIDARKMGERAGREEREKKDKKAKQGKSSKKER